MNSFKRLFLTIFSLLILSGSGSAVCYAQLFDGPRKDVVARLETLRQDKALLDSAQADWAAAQKDLKALYERLHTMDEASALQQRINKDLSNIQILTTLVMTDITYLKGQWSYLTQEEKDFVKQVEQTFA